MVFLMSAITASSQGGSERVAKTTKEFKEPSGHAIGLILSMSNGKGLAYRYWKNKVGAHISFVPFVNNERSFYNTGLSLYCKIREYDLGTLFLHGGVEYQYETQKEYFYSPTQPDRNYYTVTSNGLNIGVGPGLHVLQKYISLDVFVGYGVYSQNKSTDVPDIVANDSFRTTITAGIAVFVEL